MGTAKREYKSPLREAQTARTRELIIDALIAQVNEDGHADFSIPDVAQRAGVSVRTVYRHFPTRDDLLDAIDEGWKRIAPPAFGATVADIVDNVEQNFARFDDNAEIVIAGVTSRLGREAIQRARHKRTDKLKKLMGPLLSQLDDDRAEEVFAVFRVLYSSRTWHILRTEYGLADGRAGRAVRWAVELLVDDIERQAEEGER